MKMILNSFIILIIFCSTLAKSNQIFESSNDTKQRNFTIDYENNTFQKDGEPFRFIAGSFHYFRAHPESWQRKLRTIRASGLNAVTTYVEWSLHNPKENVYNWDGIADLERFVTLAQEEDLLVILRPGPYICAERDMGGFPYWLLRKYPDIQLRTADMNYLSEVRIWYNNLFNRMHRFLYGNGGPIIMVQVENEYGSFYACDLKYREWLRDETLLHVKDNAVLFTNDGPSLLKCGHINNVLATLDFGAASSKDLKSFWLMLRQYQEKGPLVNAEFYPGWLTHWQEKMARVSTNSITPTFIEMLKDGANVNFYMFFGGTNFGFTAGANGDGGTAYNSDLTSYDYDAPMDESGDPTDKYYKLREIIGQYLPLPNISLPQPLPKKKYGKVRLQSCCNLLSKDGREYLSTGTEYSLDPMTFEQLDQNSGLVLYETILPKIRYDPTILKIDDIRDRAYVYVDQQFVGVLSRESQSHQLPIMSGLGSKLQILVENQGRINYNVANDFKGILSQVMLGNDKLTNWNITKYPFEDFEQISSLIQKHKNSLTRRTLQSSNKYNKIMSNGPTIFYGDFIINDEIFDTYLDPSGWGKGIAFINGFNLGRYWPNVGPQVTLYVPKEILKTGINNVVLIEYQNIVGSTNIKLTNVPRLDLVF